MSVVHFVAALFIVFATLLPLNAEAATSALDRRLDNVSCTKKSSGQLFLHPSTHSSAATAISFTSNADDDIVLSVDSSVVQSNSNDFILFECHADGRNKAGQTFGRLVHARLLSLNQCVTAKEAAIDAPLIMTACASTPSDTLDKQWFSIEQNADKTVTIALSGDPNDSQHIYDRKAIAVKQEDETVFAYDPQRSSQYGTLVLYNVH